jgi:hypothetical protein
VLTPIFQAAFDAILESTAAAVVPRDDGSARAHYDVVMDFTVLHSEAT